MGLIIIFDLETRTLGVTVKNDFILRTHLTALKFFGDKLLGL